MHTVGLCSQEGFVGLLYFNSSCCSTSFSSFFVCAIYMLKSSKFIQQHKQLMFWKLATCILVLHFCWLQYPLIVGNRGKCHNGCRNFQTISSTIFLHFSVLFWYGSARIVVTHSFFIFFVYKPTSSRRSFPGVRMIACLAVWTTSPNLLPQDCLSHMTNQ